MLICLIDICYTRNCPGCRGYGDEQNLLLFPDEPTALDISKAYEPVTWVGPCDDFGQKHPQGGGSIAGVPHTGSREWRECLEEMTPKLGHKEQVGICQVNESGK